jgi:hypothetical protein
MVQDPIHPGVVHQVALVDRYVSVIAFPIVADTQVPAEAEAVLPSLMTCPVFPVIVIVAAATTTNAHTSPSEGEAGKVGVDAAVRKYPLLTAAVNEPEVSLHVIPAPTALIVIEPAPLLMVTPVPAVNVAALGSLLVFPMSSCPFVSKVLVIPLEDAPIRAAC